MTTPTPTRGPCEPWSPIWNCANLVGAEAVSGTAVQAATEILYNRSAQQFGICTFTVRPCREDCYDNVLGARGVAEAGAERVGVAGSVPGRSRP